MKVKKKAKGRPKGTKVLVRRFEDSMYVQAYKLAKTGLKNSEIAESMGVPALAFKKWMRTNIQFAKCIEDGKKEAKEKGQVAKSYRKYVYDSLPSKLRDTWDKIMTFYHENATNRIEQLLKDRGTKERQSLFLHALVHFSYNPSKAMKAVQLSRKELNSWKTDVEFAELLEEIDDHKVGFLEGALFEAVGEGHVPAIIFGLKNLGAKYAKKPTVSKVEGTVIHDHQHTVNEAVAGLTKEEQIMLLEGLKRAKQQKQLPAVREPLEVK